MDSRIKSKLKRATAQRELQKKRLAGGRSGAMSGGAMMNATGAQTGFQRPAGDFANQSGQQKRTGKKAASVLTPFL